MLQLGKNFLNHSSIKNVYYAHVHSHLTYSLLTWGCMINKRQLNDLMKIQNACVRIICKKNPLLTTLKYYLNKNTFQHCKIWLPNKSQTCPKTHSEPHECQRWEKNTTIMHTIKQLQISRGTNPHNSIAVSYADQYRLILTFLKI